MSTEATHANSGSTSGTASANGHAVEEHAHASVAFYVWIGVILAVVTGVEVAIFYMPQLDAIEAPLLVILSTAKVVLVVMFFMHLKMDHKSLTWIFLAGALVATFMVSALVVLYHFLPHMGG